MDAHTLLIQADQALFYAKSQGRNNYQLYDTMRRSETALTDVDMNIKLAVAIRNADIELNYQPIVSAKTGEIIGIEAHSRWYDKEGGLIHPSIFIPMAENLGLMHELGNRLIGQTLLDLKKVRAVYPELTLSFNVSNHLLAKPDFSKNLIEQLFKLNISPRQLHIAISESATHLDIASAKTNLMALADNGFGITLDDFGTGFSIRSNLHDFPFDELKIDISFIRRIKVSDIRIMVKAMVEMAHAMNYVVIAEGIDDKTTADILIDLGVEKLQGNYFYTPAPIEECLLLFQSKTNHSI